MSMLNQGFTQLLGPFVPQAPQPLTEEVRLRDAGLDSIHSIDLLLAIEDHYDIEFPPQLLNDATFETAGSLWSAVDQAVSAAPAGGQLHA